MSQNIHISIDVMGGDFGPRFCVLAALEFLRSHSSVSVSLVGRDQDIRPLVEGSPLQSQIRIVHADDVVLMEDKPGLALRHKRSSSMWKALEILAEGKADACVSAGNTGALMAMGRHLLKTFDGMSRPAICKPIPTATGVSYMLDLGANLDCSPDQLLQFALMGSGLAKLNGCVNPKVALLNVGSETTKGIDDIQKAAVLLDANSEINFCGFVEGNDLYSGVVDVIVCDGFVGNVALKVSEGVASFILTSLKAEFSASWWKKILSVLVKFGLKHWWERFNPSKYNGAALLGLKRIVVKSHSAADQLGYKKAIEIALQQVEADIPGKLGRSLQIN